MSRPSNALPTPPSPAPYRRTRGDRLGPDAALIYRVVPYMIVMFGCFALLFHVLKDVFGYPGGLVIPLALATTAILTRGGMRLASAAGHGFARFVLPTGESTPYEHQFSREESLVARGDIAAAADAYEAAVASHPTTTPAGISVRIRAAELYMGAGANPARAAELFREIQRIPGVAPTQDIYVSNRLIDLLLGPLKQPSRALVELRRIIERYPTSSAATHARAALTTVRRQIEESQGARNLDP
jgi:hypothetical protein